MWDIDELVDIETMFLEPRDRYDECIVGTTYDNSKLIYDADKIIHALMEQDGMNDEEAKEYFEYNILGAYVGEGTPIYVINLKFETFDTLRRSKNVN